MARLEGAKMSWIASQYQELSEFASHLQLAAPLSDVPFLGAALPWCEAGLGLIGLKSVAKAIVEVGVRKERQRDFWKGLIAPEELCSHRVVCGGRRSAFADQVRGNIHSQADIALLELIVPSILISLHPFRNAAWLLDGLLSTHRAAKKVETLGSVLSRALVSTNSAPVQLMHRIRMGKPKLLLPLGGQVSNLLVEQQLRATKNSRKFRVVAATTKQKLPTELGSVPEIAALRRKKANLLIGVSNADEHIVLDDEIRYEIWEGDTPMARSHAESAERSCAVDYAYVVFTRLPEEEAILSVQALHPLSLAAMSLFYSPDETLGTDASAFRKSALLAVRAPGSVGFEAVLKIERAADLDFVQTPRRFIGPPIRSKDLTVTMHAPPSSIHS